jgi:hypothetical protein
MVMDGDAGQSKIITYRTAGLQRFGLYVNNTAESGSNEGSDFAIRAYNDAGTLLSTPVFIKRSTGNVGIGTTTPTSKLDVNGALTISGNSISVINSINSSTSTTAIWQGNNTGPAYQQNYLNIQNNTGIHFSQTDSSSILFIDSPVTSGQGKVGIGLSTPPVPTARLHVKGSGATSATTSLLVQNSAGTDGLKITDDNKIGIGNTIYQTFTSSLTNVLYSTHPTSTITNTGIFAPGGSAFGVCVAGVLKAYVATHWQMSGGVIAQGGTGAGLDSSAILEGFSTTKGFLPPRMTTAQKNAIGTPANGLMIFDTDLGRPCFYNGAWVTL